MVESNGVVDLERILRGFEVGTEVFGGGAAQPAEEKRKGEGREKEGRRKRKEEGHGLKT